LLVANAEVLAAEGASPNEPIEEIPPRIVTKEYEGRAQSEQIDELPLWAEDSANMTIA
jgi:hypothetical protein